MTKTIYAESIENRTFVAFYGIEGQETITPRYATVYRLEQDGPATYVFAMAGGNHVEVTPRTRVTIDRDPANAKGIKGLRWCRSCEEPHLRRIRKDKIGSAHCDNQHRRNAAVKARGFANLTIEKHETEAAARADRIERLSSATGNTPETLRLATLRNAAQAGSWARFATLLDMYGLTAAEAAEGILRRWGQVA